MHRDLHGKNTAGKRVHSSSFPEPLSIPQPRPKRSFPTVRAQPLVRSALVLRSERHLERKSLLCHITGFTDPC